MTSRLIQRHDHFFKRLLDQPGAAGALIRERLPEEVARQLSPEDPVLEHGSFVDRELQEYRTDRLYRTRTLTGGAAFIYALLEHKAWPEPRIGLQLLGYEVKIWQWWVQREGRDADGRLKPLPPILPLVVYHGEAEWRIPLDFAAGMELGDEMLRPYLLDFRYSLADLGRIDDASLSREKVLRVGLLILKHGSRRGDLYELLVKLGRAALAIGFDDLVALVRYLIAEPNEINAAILRDALTEIVPGQEARIMSIAAEQWKAEGKAEGKADLLLRLLRRRFGDVPESTLERVLGAPDGDLDEWAENILDAPSLDAVFTGRRSN
ncbi:Rpn family recombination-promoting nuclease/putative transposase [Skermanella sp. TT6]|uniref:Rpn family recombination-promoting nuclease/putative transposase n=1 Tax=Skermanella cutis TaxID=2775420 RepID=A0ABX7B9P4_9PROT|nr:Rpn family recombination-promoting nuclease/putative transposase [Skermanella sp. TT6]QQP89192.1 Rpn family recombination-promoting nuclease/putative transposase [Skermanella sp. TT6]